MHGVCVQLIALLLQAVYLNDLGVDGLGSAEIGKLLHHGLERGAAVCDDLCKSLRLGPQRADIEHIQPQQNILNAVCHVVDGAGKLHDIFPVNGGQELAHKLFHRAVLCDIGRVLDFVHSLDMPGQRLRLIVVKHRAKHVRRSAGGIYAAHKGLKIIRFLFSCHFHVLLPILRTAT